MTDIDITEFDISEDKFERRPSWLLNDINEMMHQKLGGAAVLPDAKQMKQFEKTLHKQKRLPNKFEQYKNLQKEKSIPLQYKPVARHARELKKCKMKTLLSSTSEKKVNNFIELVHAKRRKQREKYDDYMRQSLRHPTLEPILTERLKSPRPVTSYGTSSFHAPTSQTRPRTAPLAGSMPSGGDSSLYPSKSAATTTGKLNDYVDKQAEILAKLKKRFKAISLAAMYTRKCRDILIYTKAIMMTRKKFVLKIENWYMKMKEERRLRLVESMPRLFLRYLKRFQRRMATRRIATFLIEFSSMQSSTIVKKFLVCVRKAQVFVRQSLQVKRARHLLLTLYWERTERSIRKQLEDQEKVTMARLQKERMARMRSGENSNVHDKWNLTHQQVIALFNHMDGVEAHRANTIQQMNNDAAASKRLAIQQIKQQQDSVIFQDAVSEELRNRIIEKYVSYKRHLHLKKGSSSTTNSKSGHHSNIQASRSSAVNVKTAKKFLQNSGCEKELLQRQLADAGVQIDADKEVRRRKGVRRYVPHSPFLCLTDPELGKPWKTIIEEVVREDIVKKKKIIQEKNAKALADRLQHKRPVAGIAKSHNCHDNEHSTTPSNEENNEKNILNRGGYFDMLKAPRDGKFNSDKPTDVVLPKTSSGEH
mmetsp:Transcript_4907/g.7481  ORF Transcript_4907/g.7481 Transcript_4907/m.7481 type:complete len:648 (+) Transcript_4907:169-2112(+)|eukprot:CAMPEP_0185040400 /NCGR_PEP_ID=MMETSP1103-20130426/38432_1 /TAXON_ID=36769 /ORGANISM="Paraphysomonas bandaiensis, Strain Caron Lab Isolate" /LENGTH=647 /DNA_ID=CAMNT_0027579691 /DNA_START=84 /DNA_END=2027 /DNA_ORIENTATION=+